MGDRHGIERLIWLCENDPDFAEGQYPRWLPRSEKEVMVACSVALIEELHDAITFFSHPQVLVKGPE